MSLQQKLKEEREAKRAHLDGRHTYILSIVASCVDLEKAEVEDAVLEGTRVGRCLSAFGGGSWGGQSEGNVRWIVLTGGNFVVNT